MKKRINLLLTGLVLAIGLTGCNSAKEAKVDTTKEVVAEISTEKEDAVVANKETAKLDENTLVTTTAVAVQTTEEIAVTEETAGIIETSNQPTGESVTTTETASQNTQEAAGAIETSNQSTSEITATVEETQSATDEIPDAYKVVLDSLYIDLLNEPDDDPTDYRYLSVGIWEIVTAVELPEERLCSISYYLEDINADGSEELFILEHANSKDTLILDIYTISDGEAYKFVSGCARDSYYMLDDGTIYNEGSSGAAYTVSQIFIFEPRALELTIKDYYFTYPKNDNYEDCGTYYNNQGLCVPSASIELEPGELMVLRQEWMSRVKSFDATRIYNYKN